MNAKIHPTARLFFLLMPMFLVACSFLVNFDTGKKSPIPTLTEVSRQTDADFPMDVTPVRPCPILPTPAPTRVCPRAGEPQPVSPTLGTNVAVDKPVVRRAGGITYPDWGNANDAADYGTTTRAESGRWGMNTNGGNGTYEIIDLGREYTLTGVGYSLDWDAAFANPLTFQVLVSTDNETWTLVTNTVHRYPGNVGGHQVDIDLAIAPVRARYVQYLEPPDGAWNGWGDFFQLRAYAEE